MVMQIVLKHADIKTVAALLMPLVELLDVDVRHINVVHLVDVKLMLGLIAGQPGRTMSVLVPLVESVKAKQGTTLASSCK